MAPRFCISLIPASHPLFHKMLRTLPRPVFGALARHHVRISKYHSVSNPDVLVVGAGVAGLSASIAAAEKGASVILLDAHHGGGATALSGGFIYAGAGTPHQKAAGYDDDPENMYRYLKEETKDAVDDQTLKEFCEGSVARQAWLERHGVQFDASLCPYKTSYPTDLHYLCFSGNETAWPFRGVARPVPRGHRVFRAGGGFSGVTLAESLMGSARDLGIKFLSASKAERILLRDDGSIDGMEVRSLDPSSRAFRRHKALTWVGMKLQLAFPGIAAKFFDRAHQIWEKNALVLEMKASAVILAAGGFAFNENMREQYVPEYSNVAPLGARGDDGSGIRLGQSVGGSVDKMGNMSAWRFIYPPTAFLEGVVVSSTGQRFIAEDVYGALLSEKMIKEHNGKAFLILDSDQWTKANEQAFKQLRPELLILALHWLKWDHIRSSSLHDLAAKTDIPGPSLEETVTSYNDSISQGKADPMSKHPEYCTPILKPPFYAVDVSPRRTGLQIVTGLTLGGLRVDGRSGVVLKNDGTVIRGLYAAGRNAVGICSNGYVSGLSIADGIFSGIRAGEHAAGSVSKELI